MFTRKSNYELTEDQDNKEPVETLNAKLATDLRKHIRRIAYCEILSKGTSKYFFNIIFFRMECINRLV